MNNHTSFFKKQALFFIILCFLFSSAAYAGDSTVSAPSHRGVNVTVDSSDLGPVDVNGKTDPEQKPPKSGDDSLSMGLNDNSEPNVGMRF